MWNPFKRKSAEELFVKSLEVKPVTLLYVSNPIVLTVFHSSPEDYSPFSIRFVENEKIYKLDGLYHMRNFCREYKREGTRLKFRACLRIEDLIQSSNGEYHGTIIGVLPYEPYEE